MKCLHKEQAQRYSSAQDLERALRDFQQGTTRQTEPTGKIAAVAGATSTKGKLLGSRRGIATAAIAVIVIALAAISFRDQCPGATTSARTQPLDEDVDWTVDVYRGGYMESSERITETPAPLENEDQLRIRVKLVRPGYPYLFWIGSDGSISQVFPEPDGPPLEQAIDEFTLPRALDAGLPVMGPDGTEVAVLVIRDTPATDLTAEHKTLASPIVPKSLAVRGS